jgi:hypothetical protein
MRIDLPIIVYWFGLEEVDAFGSFGIWIDPFVWSERSSCID